MRKVLTLSVLGFGLVTILSACSPNPTVEPVARIETRTVEVGKPPPIVPAVDVLEMRPIEWKIVTPDNVAATFEQMGSDAVLFAITTGGYEALSLNLSDLRALIEQQSRVIAIYRQSYN